MMGTGGHSFFTGGFMWIFWVFIIVGIFFIAQSMVKGSSNNSSSDNETPLDILKKRYARGEIDDEEYERRRKELEA